MAASYCLCTEVCHLQIMASSDSTSQPQGTQSTGNTIKLPVKVQPDGAVVGTNASKWNTRTGHFIRTHIPVDIKDWRLVPKNFKDDVWNALMGEFKLNFTPELARPLLEKKFSQRFRTMKTTYRKEFLKNAESLDAAITTCPTGVDPGHWTNFVTREDKPEVKEANAKNSQNRKKNTVGQTLGRSSYTQIHDALQQKDPQKKIMRVDDWYKGHERTDGTVLESAREKYELVKAAGEKRENVSTSGEGSLSQLDLDSDELTDVFGRDKGRFRGVGSHVTKKQLQHTDVATAVLEQAKSTSYAEIKTDIVAEVKSTLDKFEGVLSQASTISSKHLIFFDWR